MAKEPRHSCICLVDGMGGPTCETPYQQTCLNQCNGHGECQQGFCTCHQGWFGHDCAHRAAGVESSPGKAAGLACQAWAAAWAVPLHAFKPAAVPHFDALTATPVRQCLPEALVHCQAQGLPFVTSQPLSCFFFMHCRPCFRSALGC